MSNQWFRFYADALENPKVQSLPAATFKIWANLLCLACKNDGKLPKLSDISFAIRLPIAQTKSKLSYLRAQGLLDLVDGTTDCYTPHSWDKRQYKSDVSTERVKRFRNAKETPPDTDTDTEKKVSKSLGSRFALTELPDDWRSFCQTNRPDLNPDEVFAEFADYWKAIPGQRGRKADWFATWRNRVRDKKSGGKYETDSRNTTKAKSWTTAGNQLAEKYRLEAERLEQVETISAIEPNLRLTEGLRQEPRGT